MAYLRGNSRFHAVIRSYIKYNYQSVNQSIILFDNWAKLATYNYQYKCSYVTRNSTESTNDVKQRKKDKTYVTNAMMETLKIVRDAYQRHEINGMNTGIGELQ